MKAVSATLFCLLLSVELLAKNKIDSLRTDADVLTFVKTVDKVFADNKYGSRIRFLNGDSLQSKFDCYQGKDKKLIKSWQKADFTNDGRTDLLIYVSFSSYEVKPFVIVDGGRGTFENHWLSDGALDNCDIVTPVYGKENKLRFYWWKIRPNPHKDFDYITTARIDTLVYRFGGFVEENKLPKTQKIDSLIFTADACLGSCPVFTMVTDQAGNLFYRSKYHNPQAQGIYRVRLDAEKLKRLFDLVNYLNLSELENDYQVPWTDSRTVTLRVRFADGKDKFISDYGAIGTFGLRRLYTVLSDLRTSEKWENHLFKK